MRGRGRGGYGDLVLKVGANIGDGSEDRLEPIRSDPACGGSLLSGGDDSVESR